MQNLNLPAYSFKLRKENGLPFIFDSIRKKYVKLNPEEWVRQHMIQFLIKEKNIPQGRVGVEQQLSVNRMAKRTDIVVYGSRGLPLMIVECKSTNVAVNQSVFDQVALYNLSLKAPFLMVSNGLVHIAAVINFQQRSWNFLNGIPDYQTMLTYEEQSYSL